MTIKHKLAPNQTRSKVFTVEPNHTADHIGSGSIKVLATPAMIAFMEITARELLDAHLPDGFSSVGTHVNVRHLAPSPLGSQITIKAEITAVEGAKVTLEVEAWEGEILVGSGSHTRHLVEMARFMARVKQSGKSGS